MTYVKVMGQPLATETPSERKQRATEIVNRALGRGGDDAEEEQQTEAIPTAFERHDRLVDELSAHMTERLGTPYQVFIERDVCRREWLVEARCKSCRCFWTRAPGAAELDGAREIVDGYIATTLRVRSCDVSEGSICRCVDGRTVRECLGRYTRAQADDFYVPPVDDPIFTERQLEAARLAWSSELKRKQAEAKAKERSEVTVQDQWGDDD